MRLNIRSVGDILRISPWSGLIIQTVVSTLAIYPYQRRSVYDVEIFEAEGEKTNFNVVNRPTYTTISLESRPIRRSQNMKGIRKV